MGLDQKLIGVTDFSKEMGYLKVLEVGEMVVWALFFLHSYHDTKVCMVIFKLKYNSQDCLVIKS